MVANQSKVMYRLKVPDRLEPSENTPHDVVLSFDTTASMAPFIQELRNDLQQFITKIFNQHPETRIAIIAHGDYCSTYDVKIVDFTTDVSKLQEFVRSVSDTNGGDYPECYELVLHTAKQMQWRADAIKQLIMFGDAYPHDFEEFPAIFKDPKFSLAKHQLDWRDEADELLQMGVTIFPMQYGKGKYNDSDRFWTELAFKTRSWLLEVNDPEQVRAIITIAIYKGKGTNCLKKHILELEIEDEKVPDSFRVNLNRLKEAAGSHEAVAMDSLKSKPTQFVEETEMESGRRKAAIAADRMRRGVIVTEQAMREAENKLKEVERQLQLKELEIMNLKGDIIRVNKAKEKEIEQMRQEEKQKQAEELKQKDKEILKLNRKIDAMRMEFKEKAERTRALERENAALKKAVKG